MGRPHPPQETQQVAGKPTKKLDVSVDVFIHQSGTHSPQFNIYY